MSRNAILLSTAVVMLLLIVLVAFLVPGPSVSGIQITTNSTQMSVGQGGVSVSVQPSAQ